MTASPVTTAPVTAAPVTAAPVTAAPVTASAGRAGAIPASAGRAGAIPVALTPAGAQAVFRATLDALARPGTVRRLPGAADEPMAARVPAALLPLLALADLSTPACVVGDEAGLAGAGGAARAGDAAGTGGAVALGGARGAEGAGGDGGRTAWDDVVRVATNAPRAALAQARLVTALRPLTDGELAGLRTGTAAAPEDGALACLTVAGIAVVEGAPAVANQDAGPGRGDPATDETAAAGAPRLTEGDAGNGHADPAAADSGPRTAPPADGAGGKNGKDGGARLLLRLSGPGVPGTRAVIVTGLPAGFAAARRRLVAGFPAGADLLLIAPDGAMTGLPRTTVVREEAC